MKSCFICLIGIDGSGKTTHARFLLEYLENQGYSCDYIRGAYRPFFSYFFFLIMKFLGYWKYTKKDAYTDPLEFAPKPLRKKLASIYRFFIFLDYQLIVSLKIRLPMIMGKIIISDRYIYDMLMELQLSNTLSNRFFYLILMSMPQPDITFLMSVKEDIAICRRGFTHDFFSRRKNFLIKLSKIFEFLIIDSSADLSKNQDFIREKTMSKIIECVA
jgi:dTMP kinase